MWSWSVSRVPSKTPTSIYLANRGVKTGNVPLVPGVTLAPQVEKLMRPLVVGLYADPERIVQIRENRLLGLTRPSRRRPLYRQDRGGGGGSLFAPPVRQAQLAERLDVTRRSIEETAAAVMRLLTERRPRAAWRARCRSGLPPSRWCLPRSSDVRGKILAAAGLRFEIRPALIDERAVEAQARHT